MMDMDSGQFAMSGLELQLARIADALERMAADGKPMAPNYTRPIEQYSSFDWASIHAHVVKADADGPTHVECGGETWTRRSPVNKFAPAIWFSRAVGKDDDGNTLYLKLITFKVFTDADPLALKAREEAVKEPDYNQPTVNGLARSQTSASSLVVRKPADVKVFIEQRAKEYAGKLISKEKAGIIIPALESCFARDKVSSAKVIRNQIQKWLTGHEHFSDMPDEYKIALWLWLKPGKVEDPLPAWVACAEAENEALSIWSFLCQDAD